MASVSAELEFPPKIVISSYGLATRTSPGSIVLAVPLASRWALFSHALVWLSGHHTVEHFRTMCPNLLQRLGGGGFLGSSLAGASSGGQGHAMETDLDLEDALMGWPFHRGDVIAWRTLMTVLGQLLELALGIGIFHPGQHPVDAAVEQIVDELDDVVDALVDHDRADHRCERAGQQAVLATLGDALTLGEIEIVFQLQLAGPCG